MSKIDKSDIADEYLEQGIECFLDNQRYASALHLAGAAQEIYSSLVKGERSQDFLTVISDFVGRNDQSGNFDKSEFKNASRTPKNSVKHMDGNKDRYVSINLEFEAFKILTEAFMNALFLQKEETHNIRRFKDYVTNNAMSYV
jgi:hypothetical protein